MRAERTLSYFSKVDERLVGEYPLDGVDLSLLQDLFGVEDDDPMYEVYLVGPSQASALQPFVPEPIALQRYDYFVDC